METAHEAEVLLEHLAALGTPERAAGERAYLKSSLTHLGVRVPDMRAVVTAWAAQHRDAHHDDVFALADALWAQPVHEARMATVELLLARPGRVTTADMVWLEARLRECRTWALVDTMAASLVGELALRHPAEVLPVLDRWVNDPDFWIRRSAVLALSRSLRHDRELDRFFGYAERLLPEREFFIRKVLGWVLREVAARHPEVVSAWLRTHMAGMNLVTLREPLRKLPDAVELRALYDMRRNCSG
jgi:3-methyladenine DNA glycosylase AlkD